MPTIPAITINVISIPQGSTYRDTVTITDQLTGLPVDLTGCTVESQLRDLNDSLVGIFVYDLGTPTLGVVSRILPAGDTAKLTVSTTPIYVWGIKITKPDLEVLPQITGGATVSLAVVHD